MKQVEVQASPAPDTMVGAVEGQEDVACPLCGADVPELLFHARDVLFGQPGTYRVVSCKQCEMRYVSPRPTLAALGAHYPDGYALYKPISELPAYQRKMIEYGGDVRWRKALQRLERVVGKIGPDMRIVDVGAGVNNDFLVALQRLRGVLGVAVEFKPEAAAYIRDTLKMPVHVGTLQDARLESNSVDLVAMNEYLEHEPHPREVLSEARRITVKGGHLSLVLPYVEGRVARTFGSRWSQVDAPRHLLHFTHKTLEEMLRRSGYELVHDETYTLPHMIGFSFVAALGRRTLGSPTLADLWFAWFSSLPFLPFQHWLPEYRFAVARAI